MKSMILMRANAVTVENTCALMRDSQARSSRYVSRCVCRPVDASFLSKRVKTLAFATKTHLSASKLRFVITWATANMASALPLSYPDTSNLRHMIHKYCWIITPPPIKQDQHPDDQS